MDRVCVGCGKIMTKMGERYELATNDGLAFVCKDCAREVGIKNMFAASIVTKGKLQLYLIICCKDERLEKRHLYYMFPSFFFKRNIQREE